MKFYDRIIIREYLKELKKKLREVQKNIRRTVRAVEKEIEKITNRIERRIRMTVAKVKDAIRDQFKAIGPMLEDAFTVDSAKKAAEMAEIYGEDLALALYEVQLRMDGLQAAIIRAAAPIAAAFVPVVNTAIKALTTLTNTVGKIIASFFEGSLGIKTYEKSLQSAVQTTAAAERYLAGFDEIQRIGSNSSGLSAALIPDTEQIIPGWEALAEKIGAILAPLKEIDFSPALEATRRALKALEPVLKVVGEAAQWLVREVVIPAIDWAAENVLPALIDVLTVALETLGQVIEDIRPALSWLWDTWLKGLAEWYGEKIISDIKAMGENFTSMGDAIREHIPTVNTVIEKIDEILALGNALRTDAGLWNQIISSVIPILTNFSNTSTILPGSMSVILTFLQALMPAIYQATNGFDTLQGNARIAVEAIKEMFSGLWDFADEEVVKPAQEGTKGFLNNIIGYFEGSLKGISSAYNRLFSGLGGNFDKLSSVAPSIGSAARSVQFANIQMPSIPRLAKGAVLPANKPFLAVVGDQKRGTNIEAPLETIQQAVEMTLADRLEGMMAGFNAVTSRQEQILDAIYGLDVSDGAIAGAVARYERTMALATGGL